MRGDIAAVSWINRYGGSRNRRAALAMRLLGRLEITSGWSHDAKHIPGVQNVVADRNFQMAKRIDRTKPAEARTRGIERAKHR